MKTKEAIDIDGCFAWYQPDSIGHVICRDCVCELLGELLKDE